MSVIKGKDIEAKRSPHCGCIIKKYPLPEDADMLVWGVDERSLDFEEKWATPMHKHKDFQEYSFVIKGKGKYYVGDEVYDVEVGDLVVVPRDVPHKVVGDITFAICFALHNVYGQCIGRKIQVEDTETVYRERPEDMPKVGKYMEIPI